MDIESLLLNRLEESSHSLDDLYASIDIGLRQEDTLTKGDVLTSLQNLKARGVVGKKGAKWRLKKPEDADFGASKGKEETRVLSPEARNRWKNFRLLLAYYIECLRHDEKASHKLYSDGINKHWVTTAMYSEWIAPREGERIPLALSREQSPFTLNCLTQRDGQIFLGYPVYVVKKPKFQFVVPIFCIPVARQKLDHMSLEVELDYGSTDVNADWLEYSCPNREARDQFLKTAGLRDPGNVEREDEFEERDDRSDAIESKPFDIDRMLDALKLFHGKDMSDRHLDPHAISPLLPVDHLEEGIHNGMVVFTGKRLRFTASLVRELRRLLSHASDEEFEQSALRHLFFPEQPAPEGNNKPNVFPVLDLTQSQFTAVCNSSVADLSVVTGPPGTGKSQVVSVALASAAIRGESAVFASKNHRALDAVTPRLNGLSDGLPVIRRQKDTGVVQHSWAKLIDEILATPSNDEELHREFEYRKKYCVEKSLELAEKIAHYENLFKNRKVASSHYWEMTSRKNNPLFRGILLTDLHDESSMACLQEFGRTMSLASQTLTRAEPPFWRLLARRSYRKITREVRDACEVVEQLKGLPENYFPTQEGDYQLMEERAEKLILLLSASRQFEEASGKAPKDTELAELREDATSSITDLKRHGIETLRMLLQLGLSAYDDNEKRILSSAKILISRLEDPSLSEFVLADISRQLESAFEVLLGKIPLLAVTNLSTMRMFPSTDPAQFDLLVIDEASQCDVASTIPLLFRAKRVCVIGDPKQLKAVHQMKVSAHMHLKDKYNVQHQDFAPYDYLGFSFFDLANHWCLRERTSLLREHFRCHPRIAAYCNDVSYNNALRVLTDEGNLASTPMGRRGFHWSNVVGSCERVPQGGSICKEEVNEVIRIVREIADNEQNAFTLGVVAPFRAQANRIKDGLEKVLPTKVWDRLALLVETADGFQGDERDIIIFTVTCQPDIHRGSLWFVSQDKNRWNVAVSRARALLHIVGNLEFCSSSQVPHIRRLADHASGVKLTREEPFDSPPEKEFHEALKSAGIETVPQHPLAGYKLDLAVPNARLDIEVDGREFHLDQFGNRQSSDVWRDMTIESLGWKVLRFWVYELREDTETCVRQVRDHIAKHNSSNS